jgi:transposase
MMLGLSFFPNIYLYTSPTDMRKNFDGLVGLVTSQMGKDPVRDGAFVFVNRPGDKMKILVWDRHGFWLLYKRLEEGRFQMPPYEDEKPGAVTLTYEQLVMIIEGIDLTTVKRRKRYKDWAIIT